MTPDSIANLLQPYLAAAAEPASGWSLLYTQLAIYHELILKWNSWTNLTGIRSPEDIVRRHFGESLFAGANLGACPSLLDYGSGAGFPGVPIQLLRPDIQMTLAESQGKKAAFLREVTRVLALPTEVWADRVETMPASRQFHTVTLRAVDDMEVAIHGAASRASHRVLILGTLSQAASPALARRFQPATVIPFAHSGSSVLLIASRICPDVPRGT